MKNGETWTPICIPGISEEFLLYVYIHFYTPNFGVIIVCTDHTGEVFFECQKAGREIFKELAEKIIERTKSTSGIKNISYTDAYPAGFEDMQRRVPDITKIKKKIGWSPTHTLDSIIDSVASSFV
jgi:nucleoside-diphosphate-sugar epimerase